MNQLIKRNLVEKTESRPHRYSLTQKGLTLAKELHQNDPEREAHSYRERLPHEYT